MSIQPLTETLGVPRIARLSLDTVNRIAAGEVIQRPANAIKVCSRHNWRLERALSVGDFHFFPFFPSLTQGTRRS